jgi:hypothetical protein
MSLTNAYTVAVGRISDLFSKIRDGQAPEQFTQQLLKDWGFASSNDRAAIPLLKALGFLAPDGKPTPLYHEYRDHSRSRSVMGKALRTAYGDIFLIKEHPADADADAVKGKFKSFHNTSDNVAGLMTKTFYGLLKLADLKVEDPLKQKSPSDDKPKVEMPAISTSATPPSDTHRLPSAPGLHYNIQIHLPATKDVEVYNAIFKSLREHIFEK